MRSSQTRHGSIRIIRIRGSRVLIRSSAPDEAEAIETIKQRLHLAPLASVEMMSKIFGAFVDDNEMRLVMFAVGPLYSEGVYDPNKGLESARRTIYRAETHSERLLAPSH